MTRVTEGIGDMAHTHSFGLGPTVFRRLWNFEPSWKICPFLWNFDIATEFCRILQKLRNDQ